MSTKLILASLFLASLSLSPSLSSPAAADPAPKAQPAPPKDVTYTGTLHTGIVAIGGETTGYEVETSTARFEIDLHGDKAMLAAADKLDGKKVTVTGHMTVRKGVEVPERNIVIVSTFAAAK